MKKTRHRDVGHRRSTFLLDDEAAAVEDGLCVDARAGMCLGGKGLEDVANVWMAAEQFAEPGRAAAGMADDVGQCSEWKSHDRGPSGRLYACLPRCIAR